MAEPFRDTPTSPGQVWRPPSPQQPQADGDDDLMLPGYTDFVRVAAGAGSRVYRAWQETLDRPVAVKVLHLDDDEAIARFEREIDITVQLGRRHPNIVTVLDIGMTRDGKPCIVMEYCDGGSLHDRLRAHGPLRCDEVLDAGIVVADALFFAHGQGVLHRDVKPQNILVLPTSYVLADFGIARRADATQHTASIDWFTFQHASPQVIDGETPTGQDDVWSVGSTLFTLLDGRPPYHADLPEDNKPLAYMRRVCTGVPRTIGRADVPAGLVEVIRGCLRPDRADRFATAADLREALLVVQAQERAWDTGGRGSSGSRGGAGNAGDRGNTGDGRDGAVFTTPPSMRQPAMQLPPTQRLPMPPSMPMPPTMRPPSMPPTMRPPSMPPSMPMPMPGQHTMRRPAAPMSSAAPANLVASAASIGYPLIKPQLNSIGDRPRRSRRWRRLAVAAVAALAAGIVAGGAGLLLVKQLNRASAPPPQPVATSSSEAAAATPNANDPAIAPVLETVRLSGSSARLRWRDPTQGKATFVVVRVEGGRGEPLISVEPGRTEATVTGLGTPRGPVCFLIMAVMGENRGFSETRCGETASQ